MQAQTPYTKCGWTALPITRIPSSKTICYSYRLHAHAVSVVQPSIHKCQVLSCDKPSKVFRVCSTWSKISPTRPQYATLERVIFGSGLFLMFWHKERSTQASEKWFNSNFVKAMPLLQIIVLSQISLHSCGGLPGSIQHLTCLTYLL